jgi:hypothetical protein
MMVIEPNASNPTKFGLRSTYEGTMPELNFGTGLNVAQYPDHCTPLGWVR